MRRFFTAVTAMALLVAACGPAPVSKVVTFGLETSTPEQRTAAARILAARFDGYRTSSSAPLETRVLEDSVVIEFHGEGPDDSELQRYGAAQGILRVSPAEATHFVLVSDLDVEEATAYKDDAGATLQIVLTERAGAKMAEFTKRNIGRVMVTTLDRKEISRAQVSSAFGRKFQTSGLDPQLAMTMAVILRHGRLPVAVTKVDIKHLAD